MVLSKSAHITQLGGVVDTVGESADSQRPLDSLEKLPTRHLTKFNGGKRQVLHLGRNSYTYQDRLGADHFFTGDSEFLGGP